MTPARIPAVVADGVVRLGSPLVNWYAVGENGAVTVVDAGLTKHRDRLAPALALLGRTESDVAAVVLTHGHTDHVGVAAELHADLGVPVYVHERDAEMVRTGKSQGKYERTLFPYLRHPAVWKLLIVFIAQGGIKYRPVPDVKTYADGDVLDVPGRLRAIFTPGHSDGHCALALERAGVIFAGDALCTYNPLTGKGGPQVMPAAFNRNTAQALESLDRLSQHDATLLLPGHGEPVPDPVAAVAAARKRGPT